MRTAHGGRTNTGRLAKTFCAGGTPSERGVEEPLRHPNETLRNRSLVRPGEVAAAPVATRDPRSTLTSEHPKPMTHDNSRARHSALARHECPLMLPPQASAPHKDECAGLAPHLSLPQRACMVFSCLGR